MCGIAGFFSVQQFGFEAQWRENILRRMADVQAHRGPDDQGFWHDDLGRCSLAHRRLSIIDTSEAGHQPMLDANGRWAISFNGEIYNFKELRSQLEAAGMVFRGRTDTEVLLNSLALWGLDALPKLDGMFAFAAFDRQTGQLVLSRDAFGEKPLYYAELPGGGLAFASELQALELVPGVDLEVSPDSVAELLMFQYIGAPRTIYRGVKKLPPGHWLVARPGQQAEVGRHFEFRPGSLGFDHRPVSELADELEDILLRSLRRRLISDVPLGAFLSGGVDSSTVCALIRRRLDVPLKTFSIGFEGASESEHETAQLFARHLGTEHHDKIITPNASEFLARIGGVLDEPNADSSCLPTYLLSAFARETVTVALSGDGGDEMFGGYGRYFMTIDEQRGTKGATNTVWHPGRAYYADRILISVEEHVEELLGAVPAGARNHLALLRNELAVNDVPLFCKLRRTDVDNYMPGAVLSKVDRMSMRHSLEVRTPFLNVELARFAERLPESAIYNGKQGKLLLREVAYRYLPRELIDLPKQGFGLPMSRWAKHELISAAAELLESDDCRIATAVGRSAIARFMRRQRSEAGFATYQVWAMAMLESWLRHHPAKLDALTTFVKEELVVSSANGTHAPSKAALPDESKVLLWQLAPDVVVATEGDVIRLDRPMSDGSALSISSVLLHLIASCAEASERVFRMISKERLAVADPVALPGWQDIEMWPREAVEMLRGAILLLPRTQFHKKVAWKEIEQLRRIGVSQVVFPHPHRADGTAFLLKLRPRMPWREFLHLGLRTASRGRWPAGDKPFHDRGLMWVAGAVQGVPTTEVEMSEQFMVFESNRQLPPLPVSHDDIRERGGGLYSVWDGQIFCSSVSSGPPRRLSVIKNNASTEAGLSFVPKIVSPESRHTGKSFLDLLAEKLGQDQSRLPSKHLKPGDRIVVLTHALPAGGAERQWCYLAGALRQQGYDVHFVTIFPLDGENGHYQSLLEREGINVTRLDHQTVLDSLFWLPAGQLERDVATFPGNVFGGHLAELTSLLNRLAPRALFAQLDYTNLLAGVAGILASVPQIVMSFRNHNPSHFSYLANDWLQPMYAILTQSPRVILSGNSGVANADYAKWIGIDEARVALVPNAIDRERLTRPSAERLRQLWLELGVDERTPVVLGVFRLNEEKRPLLFVETCARIMAAVPSVHAFIIGVGPFETAVRRRIDGLGLGRTLKLLGRRDDVTDVMALSSVLLLVSIFEGMPNVVMEAQLMGIPVVASRVGGVPNCVVDGTTGFVVEPHDLDGFTQRCIQLLTDRSLRDRLGENGSNYMRSFFSRQAMARRFLQLLVDPPLSYDEESRPLEAVAVSAYPLRVGSTSG